MLFALLTRIGSVSINNWPGWAKKWWFRSGIGDWHFDTYVMHRNLARKCEALEDEIEALLDDPEYYAEVRARRLEDEADRRTVCEGLPREIRGMTGFRTFARLYAIRVRPTIREDVEAFASEYWAARRELPVDQAASLALKRCGYAVAVA